MLYTFTTKNGGKEEKVQIECETHMDARRKAQQLSTAGECTADGGDAGWAIFRDGRLHDSHNLL